MTLEQFSQISQIVAAVVVAVTLIFLTIQLKQNTRMLRSVATQGAHDQMADIYQPLMADQSLADVWLRGMEDPSSLSAVETARFYCFWLQASFDMQNWYLQTQEGLLGKATFDSFTQVVVNMYHSCPGYAAFWEQRRFMFDPTFVRYLEQELRTRPVTSGYRPLGAAQESPIPS